MQINYDLARSRPIASIKIKRIEAKVLEPAIR